MCHRALPAACPAPCCHPGQPAGGRAEPGLRCHPTLCGKGTARLPHAPRAPPGAQEGAAVRGMPRARTWSIRGRGAPSGAQVAHAGRWPLGCHLDGPATRRGSGSPSWSRPPSPPAPREPSGLRRGRGAPTCPAEQSTDRASPVLAGRQEGMNALFSPWKSELNVQNAPNRKTSIALRSISLDAPSRSDRSAVNPASGIGNIPQVLFI